MTFTYAANNPYELWDIHKSLGVMRAVVPEFTYWSSMFTEQVNSTDEWIDFEKLPARNRRIAPFVRPLGQGKPIYTDQSTGFRFKPAYTKLKDVIDPTRVLRKIAGIDPMLAPEVANNPNVRRELVRAAITEQHVQTIQRLWEWMAAQVVIYSTITIEGEEYPAVELDFRRDAAQSVTLTSGNFWGDSGVSIIDLIQSWCDIMIYPKGGFGGFPTRMTLGSSAWGVMRKDPEIKDLMSKIIMNPGADVQRGMVSSEKVVKVGELPIGGATGATIELFLYRDSYVDDNGNEVPFMPPTDVVLTASPQAMAGHRCFGAIIDPHAGYQSLPIFARNYLETGDPAAEWLLHQSAPLMVPVNPNATFHATVTAS